MPTYIVLGSYTQQGIENIKDSSKRLDAARELNKSLGSEIKSFFYTLGQYDWVAIVEAPSNEVIMQSAFAIGSGGAVRTETLVAVPAEQGGEIIKKLS